MKQCTGLVTRKRITKHSTEESITDFVIMSAELENDAREYVLTKIARNKSGITKVESGTKAAGNKRERESLS